MTRHGRETVALAGFIGLCLAASALGGAITATSVDGWYQELRKPAFNPPDWLFAPVWTTLYVLMGIAGWRVWRHGPSLVAGRALAAFVVQLALNVAWSFLFFGLRRIDLALAEIVVLWAAIVATTVLFWRIDGWSGALFVPYAAWVGYAAVLNASLWLLNSP